MRLGCCLLGLWFLTAIAGVAVADDAAQVFDQLYGAKLRAVEATVDTSDDVAMARQLLKVAHTSTGTPDLLIQVCDHAYQLGIKNAAGYDVAVEAMQLLADSVPEKTPSALGQIVAVRQRQFASSHGDARRDAGEKLIDALMALAKAQRLSDPRAELTTLHRTASVAYAIKSPRLGEIKAASDSATARRLAMQRITDLKSRLQANPNDTASAQELATTYVVNFDDPQSAVPYAAGLSDPTWRMLVPLAANSPESWTESEALKLGDWYHRLATKAEHDDQFAMLSRAAAAYQRFLDVHSTDDLNHKKAELALKEIQGTIQRAVAVRTSNHLIAKDQSAPPVVKKTLAGVQDAFESDVVKADLLHTASPKAEDHYTGDGGNIDTRALTNGTTRNGSGTGGTLNDGKTYRAYGDHDWLVFRLAEPCNIREIRTFAGHKDGRASQNYTVSVALANDPQHFKKLTSQSVSCDGGSSELRLNFKADRVVAIRFDFQNGPLGFNVYREINVIGVSTRASR